MIKTEVTAEQLEAQVLSDPTTSHWLKNAIKECHERDVVDAIADIEVLHELLIAQHNAMLKELGTIK